MARDDAHAEARRELARQLVGLAAILAWSILADPVSRRNARLCLDRALRSARRTIGAPPPPEPSAAELTALHAEARKITREAQP